MSSSKVEADIQQAMIAKRKTLALAESCTGGAIGARLVSQSGASQFFLGSVVAYANEWKEHFLKVSQDTLRGSGAASREVVCEMARGLLTQTSADYVVAVSGILGPRVAHSSKAIGTVFIAVGQKGGAIEVEQVDASDRRQEGIEIVVQAALGFLWKRLLQNGIAKL